MSANCSRYIPARQPQRPDDAEKLADSGPARGDVACEVLEVEPEQRLVYTFNREWTLTWRLVAEGSGTRLFLDHSGFDLDDQRARDAFGRMGPGWRDQIIPALADLAAHLSD